MASRNAALADAVVTALNAAPANTFNASFTAVRRYVPKSDIATLRTLAVTVIPASDESDHKTRDSEDHELKLYVGVEKYVTTPDVTVAVANTELDGLVWLVEQIADFFTNATIADTLGFFIQASITTLCDPISLLTEKVFRGVITLTFLKVI